jgi:hypothetical protein
MRRPVRAWGSVDVNAVNYASCPHCGADKGMNCRRPNGGLSERPHLARLERYKSQPKTWAGSLWSGLKKKGTK